MRSLHFVLAWLLLLGLTALTAADEPANKGQSKEAKKASDEEINRLVKDLGDDDFAKRSGARKRLEEIGAPALAILKKTAESADDVEVRSAAKGIIEALEKKNNGLVRTFEGHGERVNGVAIRSDGKRALSACWDGALRYWNLENGDMIKKLTGHNGLINSVALSADGKRALTGSGDRTMRLWDLETGKELKSFAGHTHTVWDVAFSPDGKRGLSACSDGIARLWDLDSGKELLALEANKGGRTWTVAFAADGKQAVTGGGNALDRKGGAEASLRLWDLSNGKEIRSFKGHSKDVRRVAISPDGKQLLSGSFDGTMRLWEIETGKQIKRCDGPGHFVESVCFTPDGKRAVCSYGPRNENAIYDADAQCSLGIWDLTEGKELKRIRGHAGPVLSVAISGDARFVVSGSADGTMRLWKLPGK
jgi:WD40 repeat protein